MGFKLKLFRHRTAKKEKKKEDIISSTRRSLAAIRGLPKEQTSSEFLSLVKSFFSEFFKIRYQFDYHELDLEIQRKKLKKEVKGLADNFFTKLQDFEYGEEAKPEEIETLITDFEGILAQLELKEEIPEEKKPSILQMFDLKSKAARNVELLIKKAGRCIQEGNFERARQLYQDVSKKFTNLEVEAKKRSYNKILKLHRQLSLYYEMQKPAETADSVKAAAGIKPEEILRRAKERVIIQKQQPLRSPVKIAFSSFAKLFSASASGFLSALILVHKKLILLAQFLGSLPSKYRDYVKKKNTEAIENSLENARLLIENKDFYNLKRIYSRICAGFQKLGVEEKRLYYSKVLWLHRQIGLLMPKPVEAVKATIEAQKLPVEMSPETVLPKPEPKFVIAYSRVSLKPATNAFISMKTFFDSASGKFAKIFFAAIKNIIRFISQDAKLVLGIPAKYQNYSYNKRLKTIENSLEQVKGLIEAENLSGLRRAYYKISSDFKKLKVKDKKLHYDRILWLHRQIELLTPEPAKITEKVVAKMPAGTASPKPGPKFVIPHPKIPEVSLPVFDIFTASKNLVSKTINLFIALPAKYRTYSTRRNIELLREMIAEARGAIEKNDVRAARMLYKKIGAFFNKLPKAERLGGYSRIIGLHSEIALLSVKAATQKRLARIDSLLAEAESCIGRMDVKRAKKSYEEISKFFDKLPAEEKKVSYGRIIRIHEKIAELYKSKLMA